MSTELTRGQRRRMKKLENSPTHAEKSSGCWVFV